MQNYTSANVLTVPQPKLVMTENTLTIAYILAYKLSDGFFCDSSEPGDVGDTIEVEDKCTR
jgi:hypothetical protein